MKKFVFPAIALVASSPAFAVVMIDDFDTGLYSFTTDTSSIVTDNRAATVLGGNRTTSTLVVTNPEQTFLTLKVGNPTTGTLTVGNGDGMVSRVEVAYGVLAPLNANLLAGGNTAFRFRVRSNEKPLTYRIFLESSSAGGFQPTVTGSIAAGTNFNADVAFSNWTATALGDVDAVYLQFENAAAGDYTLDSVSAVPEPATLIALGAGLAALVRRKRASVR